MHQVTQQQYFTKYVSPANPIITKAVHSDESGKLIINSDEAKHLQATSSQNKNGSQHQSPPTQTEQLCDELTLATAYTPQSLIYRRSEPAEHNQRGSKTYYASIFATNLHQLPPVSPFWVQTSTGLSFHGEGESMNLLAVHQTAHNTYDLILQNDLNTPGYTQWYYFGVRNLHKNTAVKFNIVNLYKSKSLYSAGMKPLAYSRKYPRWHRTGTSITYADNEINMEYSEKCYRTLSFEYTFLYDDNDTLFAYCYPYTFSHLGRVLQEMQEQHRGRVAVSTLGLTAMRRAMPLVQFHHKNSSVLNKRAIVVMARQHPGETVGSWVMEQIMHELAKPTVENEFLLGRFNVYCIPMVNVDGVVLGNYRGNAWGYDLNRCWDRENGRKVPEIAHVKKWIRKVNKKEPIELILDLHGHSRKMGSFFYGNPYGRNTGLFPLIASKISNKISFQDSTFTKQKSQKLTTARVVLGTMIKDTGSFYTYETSFYGYISQNKKVHFTAEGYQQLGRSLLGAIYKICTQLQKEEKTMKESAYLREARKQVEFMQAKDGGWKQDESGSDSEAQQVTAAEMQVKSKQQQSLPDLKAVHDNVYSKTQELGGVAKHSISIQAGDGLIEQANMLHPEDREQASTSGDKCESRVNSQSIRKHHNNKLLKYGHTKDQKYSLMVGCQRSEQLQQSPSRLYPSSSTTRKNYLMQKLRIFGETFMEPEPRHNSKHTQIGGPSLQIQSLRKISCSNDEPSPLKTQYRKRKNRNRSLIIRLQQQDKLPMADMYALLQPRVKVNRLQYRKIKRESRVELIRAPGRRPGDKADARLPNIN